MSDLPRTPSECTDLVPVQPGSKMLASRALVAALRPGETAVERAYRLGEPCGVLSADDVQRLMGMFER